MAESTKCQTPGAKYHIGIGTHHVSCEVDLPMELDLSEDEALLLEANIHNIFELLLRGYFLGDNK